VPSRSGISGASERERVLDGSRFAVDLKLRGEPHHGGLIFTSSAGAPLRRNRVADAWRSTVARSETVADGATFHELRHYFASLLIRQGASVKAVQAALGHASATITLDTYGQLWPDDNDRIRAAVAGTLGAALEGQRTGLAVEGVRDGG
jgi:integrase